MTALAFGVIFAVGFAYSPLNGHRHAESVKHPAVPGAGLEASFHGGGA